MLIVSTNSMRDTFVKGFAAAVEDIRRTVLETGWFGHPVTPRSHTSAIGSPGEQSPGEQLGWWRRDERPHHSPTPEHDRDTAAKEPKAPDHGIDL